MSDAKPCPCCEYERPRTGEYRDRDGFIRSHVTCDNCGLAIDMGMFLPDTLARWNTRPTLDD